MQAGVPFQTLLLALLLASVTFWAYRGVLGNAFVYYDDDQYLISNPAVRDGLTWPAVRWAFTTGHAANWHPLTWLSHLVDVQLFGLDPRGHHLTSLLLHVVNTLLVFFLFHAATGADGRSFVVAALFGLHPAHVESVAWVAERKDVLSVLFGLLTIAAYAFWCRRPTVGRYAVTVIVFALGLMSKPMLVTLPLALLLLDAWPLARLQPDAAGTVPWGARLSEKVPLFLLALASGVVTFLVQRAGGAVGSTADYPLAIRIGNATVAYVGYLRTLAWPTKLAVFYPHPGASLSLGRVSMAIMVLLLLTAVAWRMRHRVPAFAVGWLWFLGTLVPVIGIVQVGWQAMADRYTYFPSLGIFAAAAWGLASVAVTQWRRICAMVLAVAWIAACTVQTRAQVALWKNSETLFGHALNVTRDNFLAHHNLAHFYNEQGRPADAVPHLEQAMRIRPHYPEAGVNLGRSLVMLGRIDEAEGHLVRALSTRPDDPVGLNNLAFVRMQQGRIDEAVMLYRKTLAISPSWAEVQHRAGILEIMLGQDANGRARLREAAQLDPANLEYATHARGADALGRDAGDSSPDARAFVDYLITSHRQAAEVLARRGHALEAEAQIRRAERLAPPNPDLRAERGRLLLAAGRLEEARAAFAGALQLAPGAAELHNDLGFVLIRMGRRPEAIAKFRQALALNPALEIARNNLARALAGNETRN